MKRVSMPSGQAGMQLPLPLHTEAQLTAAAVPAPPVIRSMMPAAVSSGFASASPAGATIGHARKQAPQRVHASAIASPRALKSSIYPAFPPSAMPPLLYLSDPRLSYSIALMEACVAADAIADLPSVSCCQ